jgi:hypothetical protein
VQVDPATVTELPVDPATVTEEVQVDPATVTEEVQVDPATVTEEVQVDPATVTEEALPVTEVDQSSYEGEQPVTEEEALPVTEGEQSSYEGEQPVTEEGQGESVTEEQQVKTNKGQLANSISDFFDNLTDMVAEKISKKISQGESLDKKQDGFDSVSEAAQKISEMNGGKRRKTRRKFRVGRKKTIKHKK